MRAAVEATHGPRVLGGIGGFAGLWRLAGDRGRGGAGDPVLAAASDGSAPSCWSPRPSTATTPSASTWSPWWSTTWSFRGRAAVRPRLPGRRPGRPRAGRGHRRRGGRGLPAGPLRPARRRDGRAPRRHGPGRLRPGRVRPRGGGRRPPPRPRPGRRRRRAARAGRLRPAQRLQPGPPGPRPGGIGYERDLPELGAPVGEALLTPTRIYAPPWSTCSPPGSRSTPSATSPAAASPATSPAASPRPDGPGRPRLVGAAAHLPGPRRPGPGHRRGARPGDQPRRRHGGRSPAAEADRAAAFLSDREVPSWVMGEVRTGDGAWTAAGTLPGVGYPPIRGSALGERAPPRPGPSR